MDFCLFADQRSLMKINSYEELLGYLRKFETWENRGGYDFVGAVHLLGACLDNLGSHATTADLDHVAHCLDGNQQKFLLRIAEGIKIPPQG